MTERASVPTFSLETFDTTLLKKSIVGLTEFLKKKDADDLLDSTGRSVTLLFNLKKIPPFTSSKPLYIDLPFPIYRNSTIQTCIIVRDPQKQWKEALHKLWTQDGMNGSDLPKVIGISKLRKNYPTMASKRALCRSYDIFLCDTRVVEQMPRILGRTFITAGKLPIEVPIKQFNLLEPIKHRLSQTFLTLRTGSTASVRIGFSASPPKELYKNASSVINAVVSYFSGPNNEFEDRKTAGNKDNQIMSIYLTATNAPALAVYLNESMVEAMSKVMSKTEETKKRITHSKKEDKSKRSASSKRQRTLH